MHSVVRSASLRQSRGIQKRSATLAVHISTAQAVWVTVTRVIEYPGFPASRLILIRKL